jgi:hypothetical protein
MSTGIANSFTMKIYEFISLAKQDRSHAAPTLPHGILSCGSLYTKLHCWREHLARVYEVSVDEKLTTLQNIRMFFLESPRTWIFHHSNLSVQFANHTLYCLWLTQ